ncbi:MULTISPECIES: TetR/AcrR family transcriptional regulator [Actinoalloteichus]|uniref:Transcriptional regulator, TetR family n=2 Tax=Actinoalloteichus cyanogriseus TaxID=2893586 RepID=A0ABT1JQ58_ACTCY|nr:TetR/AcrR family transcriptional regulator [Actinoalloteichus caeruleus]MCP2334659.1 transcriptional regulator, TetR family [Actinoalloteichus caeruleus DSM 43889]
MIDGNSGRAGEVVRAAFRVVADVGFEGLRLRRVAADVGLDQSTLHHYFATKDALIGAVAEYTTSRLATTAPPWDLEPPAALIAHLDALLAMMRTEPELLTVSAELDLRGRRDPEVRREVERHEAGWRQALSALLTDLPRAGLPVAEAVELVIAAVKGVRLTPELAPAVLDPLATLLTAPPAPEGGNRS